MLAVIVVAAIAGYSYYSSSNSSSTTSTTSTTSGVPATSGTVALNIGVPLDIATGLDPNTNFDYGGTNGNMIVYETLVRFAPGTSTIIPWLATSWSVSPDLKTITFILRNGVKFHDETPFNATAVKFTFDRLQALDMGPGSLYDGILDHVQIVNNSAVQFILKIPYVPFLALLAQPQGAGIVSPSILKHATNNDWGHAWLTAVNEDGTGAYMLQSWTTGQKAVFVKFPDYWGGWAGQHVDQVVLNVISEPATARLELQSGQIDIDYNMAFADIPALNQTSGVVVRAYNSFNLLAITMNNQRYPTNNVLVRQALSYAYNYSAGIQSALLGYGVVPHGGFALGLPYQNASAFQYTYDPQKAVQILKQAGWNNASGTWKDTNGNSFPSLDCGWQTGIQTLRTACAVLQSNLAQIGITSTVVELQRAQFFSAISGNSTTPYFVPLIVAPTVADPANQYALYYQCGVFFNTAWYCNHNADLLAAQAAASSDAKTRAALYGQLQSVIIQDSPALWAWQQPYAMGFRTWVQGFSFTPSYEYFNWDTLWNISIQGRP
jgi:peptide/nickel transport system substrate-binding protein